jgi:hypothetical protein
MSNTREVHAVRLVLFPGRAGGLWTGQFTELHYERGFPLITGARGVFVDSTGLQPGIPSDRLEALVSAAMQLRSQ